MYKKVIYYVIHNLYLYMIKLIFKRIIIIITIMINLLIVGLCSGRSYNLLLITDIIILSLNFF